MPPPQIWGPFLWKVLHSIGPRVGGSPLPIRADEERQLQWLITNLESIIPCQECRFHIHEFKKEHPIPSLTQFSKWIWDLHESVNKRLGKEGGPSLESIERSNILLNWVNFVASIKESILTGAVSGGCVKEYTRHLKLWGGFACI